MTVRPLAITVLILLAAPGPMISTPVVVTTER